MFFCGVFLYCKGSKICPARLSSLRACLAARFLLKVMPALGRGLNELQKDALTVGALDSSHGSIFEQYSKGVHLCWLSKSLYKMVVFAHSF